MEVGEFFHTELDWGNDTEGFMWSVAVVPAQPVGRHDSHLLGGVDQMLVCEWGHLTPFTAYPSLLFTLSLYLLLC